MPVKASLSYAEIYMIKLLNIYKYEKNLFKHHNGSSSAVHYIMCK